MPGRQQGQRADEQGERAERARPGRPTDADLTERILATTLELLVDTGYAGLRIETVARRVGCGKPAVYRRYASKAELVAAAVLTTIEDHPEPNTGSLSDDLLQHVLVNQRNSAQIVRSDPDAFGLTAAFDPEVFGILWERGLRERHQKGVAVVERGVARGEIDPDVDADALLDAIAGFTLYRQTIKHIPIGTEHYRGLIAALVAHPPLRADAEHDDPPHQGPQHEVPEHERTRT